MSPAPLQGTSSAGLFLFSTLTFPFTLSTLPMDTILISQMSLLQTISTRLPLCLLAFNAPGEANLSQSFTTFTGRAPLFRHLRSLYPPLPAACDNALHARPGSSLLSPPKGPICLHTGPSILSYLWPKLFSGLHLPCGACLLMHLSTSLQSTRQMF